MSNKNIVSVAMISYNHEQFIAEAISSVLDQHTTFPYELVISQDCSSDNTDGVIRELIKTHPKGHVIRYFPQEINIGMIPNFIFCLKECRGEFIAICEGDDYWTDSEKLQKQVNFFRSENDYAIAYHYAETYHQNTKVFNPFVSRRAPNLTPAMIFASHNLPTASVMFKNVLANFPEEFARIYNGDTFLFCLIANQTGKGAFFDITIGPAIYRQHDSGNWSSLKSLIKYTHSLYTMKVLYRLFKKYRLPLKTRMHQMLLEASTAMSVKEYYRYYRQYLSFLIANREVGLIVLSFKNILKKKKTG